MLIGHSLGGTAVLAMALQLPKVKAVVTIGALFEANHVIHNFNVHLGTIEIKWCAKVNLSECEFTIKQQFVDYILLLRSDYIALIQWTND